MKWFSILVCLGIIACAGVSDPQPLDKGIPTIPNYKPDESNPKLVEAYLTLPCDLLAASVAFQSMMVRHEKNHFEECVKSAETSRYVYAETLCAYVGMHWKFIYVNQKSVEKAFNIMCNEDATRKNPEYSIEF